MQLKKRYWFKAKLYGWGWYPATWEGWLCLLIYFAVFFIFFKNYDSSPHNFDNVFFDYISPVFILTAILIAVCFLKGEKPRWRWGK